MGEKRLQLPQGMLDLLILKTLELQPVHGWGISERLQQRSRDAIPLETLRNGGVARLAARIQNCVSTCRPNCKSKTKKTLPIFTISIVHTISRLHVIRKV